MLTAPDPDFEGDELLYRAVDSNHLQGSVVTQFALVGDLFGRSMSVNRERLCCGPYCVTRKRRADRDGNARCWRVAQAAYGSLHGLVISATTRDGMEVTVRCEVRPEPEEGNRAHCGAWAIEDMAGNLDARRFKDVRKQVRKKVATLLALVSPEKTSNCEEQPPTGAAGA